MDTRTVVVGDIRAVVSSLTNGGDILRKRILRLLSERIPALQGKNEDTLDRDLAEYVGRFVACAYIVKAEGLSYPLPDALSTADEIWQAFQAYGQDEPAFWRALSDVVWDMESPRTPEEARPLSAEDMKHPNGSRPIEPGIEAVSTN